MLKAPIDPQFATRLAKVLALMASPIDGEALAAARMVLSLLRTQGIAADDFAQILGNPSGPTPSGRTGTPDGKIHALETRLSAANATIKALKAELSHWQSKVWDAASVVADLEDRLNQAEKRPPDGPADPAPAPPVLDLPRTHKQKSAAITSLLTDPKTGALSDRELARRLLVSPQTIGNWRRRLGQRKAAKSRAKRQRRDSIRSKRLP